MEPVRLTIIPSSDRATRPRRGEPVAAGLPFPRGVVRDVATLTLRDSGGRPVPIQVQVLDRWADGSVRWALVVALASWEGTETPCWLSFGDSIAAEPTAGPRVSVEERDGGVEMDTGVARFACKAGGAFPFDRVTDTAGVPLLDTARTVLRLVGADGVAGRVVIDAVSVEERGPVRAAVRWRGRLTRAGDSRWIEIDALAHVFAGLSVARLSLTLRNPRPAAHPGNFWELGDAGSVLLREASLHLVLSGTGNSAVACSVDASSPLAPFESPFELYQESSGGARWDSPAHVNREGRVPMRLRGYRLRSGSVDTTGLRADPVLVATRGSAALAVTMPAFWQNFPRALEARGDTVVCGMWPAAFPDSHELQGGEQKTHELALCFGEDPVSDTPLDWCRAPALLRADPAWYCRSGAVPHIEPEAGDSDEAYRNLVHAAIDGDESFVAGREAADEYGWRHFGDIYANHEAVRHDAGQTPRQAGGGGPLISHYNNQYDAIAGLALQFLRTGDRRWWAHMAELAAHVRDIDVYRTDGDKAAYSGGPFWHTVHYVDTGRSTHRAYPRADGVPGGGPSNEHNYTSGLLLHYWLTGDPRSRETVVALADWVRRIDDGARSPFRWLAGGATGLASSTRDVAYHGPGRGAANSVNALLDAHRLTGDAGSLEMAEALIRRCIHPADNLEARRLLDAEERWSYTVFLQVLGRYLQESAERGALGLMYAWARESLLSYARWMAAHERPYLETPERLEFPTETWAAQDVRKCEVLLAASQHVTDAGERQRFRERAAFFFDASVGALASMPTRTLARPVVIMLGQGFRKVWFDARPDVSAPAPDGSYTFGVPEVFVPQRQRAVARAKRLAVAFAVVVAGLGAWVAARLAGVL